MVNAKSSMNLLDLVNSNVTRNGYITIALKPEERLAIQLLNGDENPRHRVIMTRFIEGCDKYRLFLKEGDQVQIRGKRNTQVAFGAPVPDIKTYVFEGNALKQVNTVDTKNFTSIFRQSINTACVDSYIEMQSVLFGSVTKVRTIVAGTGVPRITFTYVEDKVLSAITNANPHDTYFGFKLVNGDWKVERMEYTERFDEYDVVATAQQRLGSLQTFAGNESIHEQFKLWLIEKLEEAGFLTSYQPDASGAIVCYKSFVDVA